MSNAISSLSSASPLSAAEGIAEQEALALWKTVVGNSDTVTIGRADERETISSTTSMRMLTPVLQQNRVKTLDVSGLRFTAITLPIFSLGLYSLPLHALKLVIDDAAFLVSFCELNRPLLPRLRTLFLTLEKLETNRAALVDALAVICRSAVQLEGLRLEEFGLTDEEVQRVFPKEVLPRLTLLSLKNNQITENTLLYLSEHPFLAEATQLLLSENEIRAIPQKFITAAAKPGLLLNLQGNRLPEEQIDLFFDALPKKNRPSEIEFHLMPQKIPVSQRLTFHPTIVVPALPYSQLFHDTFAVTHTLCRFSDDRCIPLNNDSIRALLFHHFKGRTATREQEALALREIFCEEDDDDEDFCTVNISLPAPFAPPPANDTLEAILAEETITPENASLRLRKLTFGETLDLTIPINSEGAVLAVVELLSHQDCPIKELMLDNAISDSQWKILLADLNRFLTLQALHFFEIPVSKMNDLLFHGKEFLARLEYIDFSGAPENAFIGALLAISVHAPLKYVDLSGRMIRDAGAQALLAVRQPEHLLLDNNGITNDGFELICETYRNRPLRELALDCNPITSPFALLILHHHQPLTISMPQVRFTAADVIELYDSILNMRNESYIAPVKHEFRYHLFDISARAEILVRQSYLNIAGSQTPLPIMPETGVLRPHLGIIDLTAQLDTDSLNEINASRNRPYYIARLLSLIYPYHRASDDLLELFAEETGIKKEQLEEAMPEEPGLDREERCLAALKKITPYPVFIFDQNSKLAQHKKFLVPHGELATPYYAINLYRTQEGRYFLLTA